MDNKRSTASRTSIAINRMLDNEVYGTIDNRNIIRCIFHNGKGIEPTFNTIKVMFRAKDFKDNKDSFTNTLRDALGSNNEKIIFETSVSNEEELEAAMILSKTLCDKIPYLRAYYCLNGKSIRKTISQLGNDYQSLLNDILCSSKTDVLLHRRIGKLSKSAMNKPGSDAGRFSKFRLYDFDNLNDEKRDFINRFKYNLLKNHITYWELPTVNGVHIVVNSKELSSKLDDIKNKDEYLEMVGELVYEPDKSELVDVKHNAMTLMYCSL